MIIIHKSLSAKPKRQIPERTQPDRLRRVNPVHLLWSIYSSETVALSPETAPANIMLTQVLKFRSLD